MSRCASCAACVKSAKPMYKKVVINIYPSLDRDADPKRTHPKNLSALKQYGISFPEKLAHMGRYILKRIRTDLAANRFGNVHIGMLAFGALIQACHSDALAFYTEAFHAMRVLLAHRNPELKVLAAQTFDEFMQYQDEDSYDHKLLEGFFEDMIALCAYTTDAKHAEAQERVRKAGLTALSQLVRSIDAQRTVRHMQAIIPAVLDNMVEEKEEGKGAKKKKKKKQRDDVAAVVDGDASADGLRALAYTCLTHVVATPLTNINNLLDPIFAFFDTREWAPTQSCVEILQIVATFSQISRLHLLFYPILNHSETYHTPAPVDSPSTSSPSAGGGSWSRRKKQQMDKKFKLRTRTSHAVRVRVLEVVSELASTLRLDMGPWEGVLHFLIRKLHHDPLHVENKDDWPESRDATTRCVLHLARKVGNPVDVVEMCSTLLHYLEEHNGSSNNNNSSSSSGGDMETVSRLAVLQCVDALLQARPPLPGKYIVSDAVIVQLLRPLVSAQARQSEVPVLLSVLQNLIISPSVIPDDEKKGSDADNDDDEDDEDDDGDGDDDGDEDAERDRGKRKRRKKSKEEKEEETPDKIQHFMNLFAASNTEKVQHSSCLASHQLRWIQTAIYKVLTDDDTTRAVYASCLRLLVVLLYYFLDEEVLAEVPMLFSLQALCDKRRESARNIPSVAQSNSYRRTVVHAYLLYVARVFLMLEASPTARQYVSQLEEIASRHVKIDLEDLTPDTLREDLTESLDADEVAQVLDRLLDAYPKVNMPPSVTLREQLLSNFEQCDLRNVLRAHSSPSIGSSFERRPSISVLELFVDDDGRQPSSLSSGEVASVSAAGASNSAGPAPVEEDHSVDGAVSTPPSTEVSESDPYQDDAEATFAALANVFAAQTSKREHAFTSFMSDLERAPDMLRGLSVDLTRPDSRRVEIEMLASALTRKPSPRRDGTTRGGDEKEAKRKGSSGSKMFVFADRLATESKERKSLDLGFAADDDGVDGEEDGDQQQQQQQQQQDVPASVSTTSPAHQEEQKEKKKKKGHALAVADAAAHNSSRRRSTLSIQFPTLKSFHTITKKKDTLE